MAKKLLSDLARFFTKVEVDPVTGCWTWTQRLDRDGYGALFRVGSRTDGTRARVRPHRFSYEQLIGPIPDGLVIDHICRNRACQNPLHMEPVTHAVNTKRGARATSTHCKRGHELSGENVRILPNSRGWVQRLCRTCFREYQAAYQKANGGKHQKAYRERCKEKRKSVLATRS